MYYDKPKSREYRVVVGHTSIRVFGCSRDEALQNARQRLCSEMPRMWDVIERMDPRNFQVEPLAEPLD